MFRIAFVVMTACFLGCGLGANDVCIPGGTQECTGPAGCTGGQQCVMDGTAWGECVCDAEALATSDEPDPRVAEQSPGQCVGRAAACGHFDTSYCSADQVGCALDGRDCVGRPRACATFDNATDCHAQHGCWWQTDECDAPKNVCDAVKWHFEKCGWAKYYVAVPDCASAATAECILVNAFDVVNGEVECGLPDPSIDCEDLETAASYGWRLKLTDEEHAVMLSCRAE